MDLGRSWLRRPRGRTFIAVASIGCVASSAWTLIHHLGPSPAIAASTRGQYICSETRKSFVLTIEPGMTLPVLSHHSGKRTGYPAELCYWTADGQVRKEPIPVLLNSYLGQRGPTFCPDCGRLVRARNPQPVPGSPPPTREQYQHLNLKEQEP